MISAKHHVQLIDEFLGNEAGGVGAFGERLRRQRELRGVSLDEIAKSTKIGTRLLRALEEEQFDRLPGGIFNKGFVRAYAKYVGINEEEAISDYLEAAGHGDTDLRMIAEQSSSGRYSRDEAGVASSSRNASFPFVPALILIVAVVGAAGGWQAYKEGLRGRVSVAVTGSPPGGRPAALSQPQAAPSSPAKNAESPVASTANSTGKSNAGRDKSLSRPTKDRAESDQLVHPSSSGALPPRQQPQGITSPTPTATEAGSLSAPAAVANPAESGGTPFEVIVRAKDRAWVSIKSDGKLMVRGVIKPPDIKTIHATDQVVLWTGNAADVEVSFNGKDVPLTGGQNDERLLVFNARGLLPPQAAQ